jgi:hypothetical protein
MESIVKIHQWEIAILEAITGGEVVGAEVLLHKLEFLLLLTQIDLLHQQQAEAEADVAMAPQVLIRCRAVMVAHL